MKRPITSLIIGFALFIVQLGAQPTFTVSPQTITAAAGGNITVDINVSGFTNIVSMQYSMTWNKQVLQFISIDNITNSLPGFTMANFGTTNTANGNYALSWLDPDVTGKSVSGGTRLYSVTFKVLTTNETTIAFANAPTPIEVVNAAGTNVGLTPMNSVVNAGGGNPGPTATVTFSASDTTVAPNAMLCTNVRVNGFTNLASVQYSMAFDQTKLQFSSITNLNLSNLTLANFNTTQAAQGILTLNWNSQGGAGVTVANGTTIYRACFTAIGASSCGTPSQFRFTSTPTAAQASNASGGSVTFQSTAGNITICSGTPPPGTVTFSASTVSGAPNTTLCTNVSVDGFTNLASVQFSMAFDQTRLQFANISNLNLSNLALGNFNTTQASQGILTLNWTSQGGAGVTVASGTNIYRVCFTAIGASNCATPSQFRFTSTPVLAQATNASANNVTFQSNPGNITICSSPPPSGFSMVASDTTIAAGGKFCTRVSVNGFTNIVSMQYSMAFDQTKLRFDSLTSFNLLDLTASSFGVNQVSQGILTLSWLDQSTIGVTRPNGTVIYRVCFTVIGSENCTTPTQFRFTNTPTTTEVTNASGGLVAFQSTPANITVCGGTPPPPPTGFSVTASDTTIASGGKFCTKVRVNGFTNIVSMQYSMAFDQTKLRFDSIRAVNLKDLTLASFGTNQAAQGVLTMSWLDQATTGVSVTNGTAIYEVCFTAIGAVNCTTPTQFRFTSTPTTAEVTNSAGGTVTFQSVPGNITICGGTPPPPPTGFSVTASDTTIASGGKFCTKVRVNGFSNIVSMQYSMSFDQTRVRFDSIRALNLKDLSVANFGTNQSAQGVLTLSWMDQATTGVTLTNGTTIYEVCFTAIGAENCTTPSAFRFTNTPTMAEVTNSAGATVAFQSVSGSITICGGTPPPPGTLRFSANEKVISNSAPGCIDVTAENFTKIVSAQFSIKFNPAVIKFSSVTGFGLPDLSASNFGTANANNGTLTFSWFDQSTKGVTVANGTVIFQLCFTGVGTGGQSSNISFDGTPTAIEVTDASNKSVTPTFVTGKATLESSCAGPVVISNPVVTNVTCKGSATGAIAITTSGGTGLFVYTWKNAAGTTVGTQKNLTSVVAGTYTVTVTSCSGTQSTTASYTITEPSQGIGITSQVNNVVCMGAANGSISITVSGGLLSPPSCPNYTYLWSNGATTKDIGNLPGGTYRVTITDCSGCQFVSNPIVVAAPTSALVASLAVTHVKCFGTASGTITVTASGGVGPYQYRINNGVWQNSNVFTDLPGGAYAVDTRDALGCIVNNNTTINSPATALVVVSAPVHATSGKCDGSITLTVSGGGTPYTYTWAGPGNFTSNTKDVTNLCSGNYSVTVTDANGCSIVRTEQVRSPLQVTATRRNACFNVCDGSIMLNVTGGIPPLSYQWNSGLPALPTQSNLCPGSYSVTVTSPADNQTQTLTINITQATSRPSLTVVNVSQPSTSFSCDGTIITTGATGGAGPPYTFKWDNNSTVPTRTGLCEGTYSMTLTDGNGCTSLNTYTLDFIPPSLSIATTVDASCFSNSIGAITVQATGGISPYRIVISGPSGTFTQNNDADGFHKFSNLAPGNYTISVLDSGVGIDFQQTSTTASVTVTNLSLAPINIFPATISQKGKITTQPAGGRIPYTFQWSNGSNAQNPSNLDADCYVVTVGDANGCFRVFSNICVGLLTAQETITSPRCPDSLGTIVIKPQGGNWPYSFRWRNSAGQVVDNDSILQNQPVGEYNVLITDALGVSILQSHTIKPISNLAATAVATSNYNGFNVRCNGGNTGEARVMAVNGSAPYTYMWSNNATTATVSNLPAGMYTITVTDKEGCKVTQSVSITAPPVLTANAQGAFIGCSGTKSGQATATVSGGVSPYSFVWSDASNQKTATAVLLSGGTYTVTVTDANGCNSTKSANVIEPPVLNVNVLTTPDEGGPSGTAKAVATGGTRPYVFTWQDLTNTDSTISRLLPGRYFVRVTDANSCVKLANGIVDDATNCLFARAVITPEGDGRNEEFKIGCLSRFHDNHLEIYNRWGQLVYEVDNYNDADLWRGTNMRGNPVPDGVYFWVFEYTDPGSKQRLSKKGSVTVLRR